MKKVFPAISVLITLSLLGLIYFQVQWLQTAKLTKEKQLRENIYHAAAEAARMLMEEKGGFVSMSRKAELLKSNDRMRMDILRPSVIQRYTRDEIASVIRTAMERNYLAGVAFEFAVSDNSLTGDQVESDRFFSYYSDSAHNINFVIPLEPSPGSSYENLSKEEYLVIIVPHQNALVFREISWFIFGSLLFTVIITTAFFLTIRALLRQKKLSEIKSDFINNMTHEFKTPIATISLAVDALRNEKVSGDKEKTGYFTRIIKEENKRMNQQVETILQAALLDKQQLQLKLVKLSVHDLVRRSAEAIQLSLNEKQGRIELSLEAENDLILGDEVHFTNLISNLLDNALKYSKEQGLVIGISTYQSGSRLHIRIEDNGIGMSKETLSRIFEKFYRAHTGNLHNVKGFGLGLTYVKSIVEAHKGSIRASSSLGKGSIFTITLPTVV